MISVPGLAPLSEHRTIDKAAMMYKIINDHVDIPAGSHLKPVARITRGQQAKLQVPQSRTNVHLHSFFPSSVRLWNTLPDMITTTTSVRAFKLAMAGWLHS